MSRPRSKASEFTHATVLHVDGLEFVVVAKSRSDIKDAFELCVPLGKFDHSKVQLVSLSRRKAEPQHN